MLVFIYILHGARFKPKHHVVFHDLELTDVKDELSESGLDEETQSLMNQNVSKKMRIWPIDDKPIGSDQTQ